MSTKGRRMLSGRETDVLKALSQGFTYEEIGARLGVSPHTVSSHVKNAYRKLKVHSAAEAVMRAVELRLLDKER